MDSEILSLPWAFATVILLLISAVGFFVARHFTRTDRLANTLDKLNGTLIALSSQIEHLQEKDAEKSRTIDKLFNLVEKLSSQVGKLREAYIGLKTSVEHCQQHREDCTAKENRL